MSYLQDSLEVEVPADIQDHIYIEDDIIEWQFTFGDPLGIFTTQLEFYWDGFMDVSGSPLVFHIG